MPSFWKLPCLLSVFVCAGCGSGAPDNRPPRLPVTGTVLYDKQPVEGAMVVFSPQEHPHAAIGRTDSRGRFQLMTFLPGDGAVAGDYMVAITKVELSGVPMQATDDAPVPAGTSRSLLPDKYADPQTSGLRMAVRGGEAHDFTFELEPGPINAAATGRPRRTIASGE